MRYCIGIPTINRADLLEESICDLRTNCPDVEVIVVDNGKQGLRGMLERSGLRFQLIENETNQGVAGSWNQIARIAFGAASNYSWVWMLNDDVVAGKSQGDIDSLCAESSTGPETPPVITAEGWCSFLLPAAVWAAVGEFDEAFFPAYYEDDDYMERMRAQGLRVLIWEARLQPVVFRNSQTIKKDPSLNLNFAWNQQRFVEKWGAEALYRTLAKKS